MCFLGTLTPTQRRRLRKQRAFARLVWFQIKQGNRLGDVKTLSWIRQKLGSHHSRDPSFLHRVQIAIAKAAAMEHLNKGWKCSPCKVMNKKLAEYCQKCGSHWQQCCAQDTSWTWSSTSDSWTSPQSPRQRSSSARRRSRTKGTGQKADKGGKGHGGKGQEGKASPFANTSYLSNQSSGIPWPMMDFEQFQQNQSSGSTAPVTQPTHQAAQDLVSALKKAFPEPSAMPQQLREAYERAELNGVRQITKDLHAATSALGRARKAHQEASESRKLLKQGWMRHLQESLKAWESQLDNYRANMAKLQDAEAKALQEVSLAKKMISQLNTKTEAPPLEESTLLEDTSDPTQDKEEEKLRTQLQDTMTACLSTVGVKKEDVLEISDEEVKEGETKKRQRPTEHGSS